MLALDLGAHTGSATWGDSGGGSDHTQEPLPRGPGQEAAQEGSDGDSQAFQEEVQQSRVGRAQRGQRAQSPGCLLHWGSEGPGVTVCVPGKVPGNIHGQGHLAGLEMSLGKLGRGRSRQSLGSRCQRSPYVDSASSANLPASSLWCPELSLPLQRGKLSLTQAL